MFRAGTAPGQDAPDWIEFGRFAADNRRARGDGKPETFRFLGFTHVCATTRIGKFRVGRITDKKRMHAKRRSVKAEMRRRAHLPIPEQGAWLARVLRGHYAYYGVPGNGTAIGTLRHYISGDWTWTLRRRSQRSRCNWARTRRLIDRWLPPARITHPWPNARFDARTQGRSPVR